MGKFERGLQNFFDLPKNLPKIFQTANKIKKLANLRLFVKISMVTEAPIFDRYWQLINTAEKYFEQIFFILPRLQMKVPQYKRNHFISRTENCFSLRARKLVPKSTPTVSGMTY